MPADHKLQINLNSLQATSDVSEKDNKISVLGERINDLEQR